MYTSDARADIRKRVSPAPKTLIDLDEKLLAQAAEFLGTRTKKDTVNRALEEYVKLQLRLRFLEWMASDDAPDLLNPAVREAAWGECGTAGGRRS
jgi:Arc/MetJ family transcription regulator